MNFSNAQDKHIKNLHEQNITSFENDFHKRFSENEYTCEYTKLNYFSHHRPFNFDPGYLMAQSRACITLLKNECDVISDMHIVVPAMYFDKITIRRIEFTIDGSDFGKVCFTGAEKIIYNLMQKKVINHENKYVIQFPFFDMIPLLKLTDSKIVFWILAECANTEENNIYKNFFNDIDIYGKKYILKDDNQRQLLINEPSEYIIIHNQYCGEESVKTGINRYKLGFVHPVFLLHINGIDKTKIKNIELLADSHIIADGVEEFDNMKKIFCENNNYNEIDSHIVIFGNTFNKNNFYLNSTLNFSTFDRPAQLIIDVDEIDEDSEIFISALNYNTVRFASGKAALRYSK